MTIFITRENGHEKKKIHFHDQGQLSEEIQARENHIKPAVFHYLVSQMDGVAQEEPVYHLKKPSKKVNYYKRSYAALSTMDIMLADKIASETWPTLMKMYESALAVGDDATVTQIERYIPIIQAELRSLLYYTERPAKPINRLTRTICTFSDSECHQLFRFKSKEDLNRLKRCLFPQEESYIQICSKSRNVQHVEELLLASLFRYAHGMSIRLLEETFGRENSFWSRSFKFFNQYMIHNYSYLLSSCNLIRWKGKFKDFSALIAFKLFKSQTNPRYIYIYIYMLHFPITK